MSRCFSAAWASLGLVSTAAFVYKPGSGGEIWDPSVTWWRGNWYLHAMYQYPGDGTNVYKVLQYPSLQEIGFTDPN